MKNVFRAYLMNTYDFFYLYVENEWVQMSLY